MELHGTYDNDKNHARTEQWRMPLKRQDDLGCKVPKASSISSAESHPTQPRNLTGKRRRIGCSEQPGVGAPRHESMARLRAPDFTPLPPPTKAHEWVGDPPAAAQREAVRNKNSQRRHRQGVQARCDDCLIRAYSGRGWAGGRAGGNRKGELRCSGRPVSLPLLPLC